MSNSQSPKTARVRSRAFPDAGLSLPDTPSKNLAQQRSPGLPGSPCQVVPGHAIFSYADDAGQGSPWAFSPVTLSAARRGVTALVASGQRDKARTEATTLIRLDPKWPAGATRAADRMTAQKVSRYILEEGYWMATAVSLASEPPPPELLGVMATGAEGMGRHNEALSLAEQALAAAKSNGQTNLVEILSARLTEWRARREPSTR